MKWIELSERKIFIDDKRAAIDRDKAANKRTMQEMDEQYKSCPIHTNTYEVDGVKHTVTSHFVGEKNINDVMFDYAYHRTLNEMLHRISE